MTKSPVSNVALSHSGGRRMAFMASAAYSFFFHEPKQI
jgi:hypothetical protein